MKKVGSVLVGNVVILIGYSNAITTSITIILRIV